MLIEGLYTLNGFSYEENTLNATVTLNPDHDIFKGHFPENPVMPGVCTLQIVKELTEKATSQKLFLTHASNVKFLAIINPNENPKVDFNIEITETEAIFKVKCGVAIAETPALKLSATFKPIE